MLLTTISPLQNPKQSRSTPHIHRFGQLRLRNGVRQLKHTKLSAFCSASLPLSGMRDRAKGNMQRDLKFRAWDKITKKVCDIVYIDFEDVELLQFAGLRQKREGDL